MKPFHCDACGSLVFFENSQCVKCGHALGFLPEWLELSALEPGPAGDLFRPLVPVEDGRSHRWCANGREYGLCNWLVPEDDPQSFCVACRLNEVIPDLSVAGNKERWGRLENAKRRLIYTLLKLRLPVDAETEGERTALRFRFLGDSAGAPVLTGHAAGVITVNIVEADDAEREERRVSLHEPFRTLLGHFRHEVGHYYWDRLIANSSWLERFRALFGDEREDYAQALRRHYEKGPAADWGERGVSAYASSHPWEDWAETWAHYLHIVDTIETAAGFGLTLKPRHPAADSMTADPKKAAKEEAGFEVILNNWFPLTYALNSLNRGMGLLDLYPFVLSDAAIGKLRFVHEVIEASRRPEGN
jgi:hypothetical protein